MKFSKGFKILDIGIFFSKAIPVKKDIVKMLKKRRIHFRRYNGCLVGILLMYFECLSC